VAQHEMTHYSDTTLKLLMKRCRGPGQFVGNFIYQLQCSACLKM